MVGTYHPLDERIIQQKPMRRDALKENRGEEGKRPGWVTRALSYTYLCLWRRLFPFRRTEHGLVRAATDRIADRRVVLNWTGDISSSVFSRNSPTHCFFAERIVSSHQGYSCRYPRSIYQCIWYFFAIHSEWKKLSFLFVSVIFNESNNVSRLIDAGELG